MKKLIAISMMIALVAGAAFAQANIGFTLDTRLDVNGTSHGSIDWTTDPTAPAYGTAPKPTIGGGIADGYLVASAENDDGTLGGLLRIQANSAVNGGGTNPIGFHRAFIWWKPIDQLKIFLGKEKDGLYSTGGALTDWAFHQGAEGYLNFHDWGYWRTVFPGNWDTFGLAFEIYPIEGLNINLVIPTGTSDWPNDQDGRRLVLEDVIYHLRLQANYNIAGIGTIYFSYIGAGKPAEGAVNYSNGNIGASFLLDGPVEGLKVQAGFATDLNAGNRKSPLYIGLAAHYASGDFGVKFRSAFEIGHMQSGVGDPDSSGRVTYSVQSHAGAGGVAEGLAFQFNVMPWYNLGFLEARLDIGLRMTMPSAAGATGQMAWHINPYARVPIPGGRFQFGFKVDGRTVESFGGAGEGNLKADVIRWSIPLGLVFSF